MVIRIFDGDSLRSRGPIQKPSSALTMTSAEIPRVGMPRARRKTHSPLARMRVAAGAPRGGRAVRWILAQTRRELQQVLCTWTGICCYCGAQVTTGCEHGP
jgi:hypothetical protein